ncbi:glutathione peroxidase [Brevifollis gellanilyticus]|uniref:Glutathione peroxidase n=1 Tax=Brevifollis gellanilyticus TaxID=748831 RepID=A0A512M7U0_9BACT|nr:glutathione peroxidase [Brevifollis gellanilyticus]GEP42785.1 glutathione peroxidase [Brevifollis gellanilyticus]
MKILLAALLMIATSLLSADLQSIELKTIDGKEASLKDYAGKVLLIVNVASECGYTGQYAGLQALHEKYKDKGFAVLGFPCNDFGGQEPGSESEIKTFCTSRYNVTFPMFSKVKITGGDKHPLYAELTGGTDVQWNFEKFLIGKDGKLISRHGSDAEPEGGDIETAVKKALGLP